VVVCAAARACARGPNQESLISELLTFETVPLGWRFYPPNGRAVMYGRTGLPNESFRSLKRRLIKAGFVFSWSTDRKGVRMHHPLYEMESRNA